MGYRDSLLQIADAFNSAGNDTDYSTTTVDVGTVDRELGTGEPMVLEIRTTANATIVGSLRFILAADSAADMSSSPVEYASSKTYTTAADLVANTIVHIPIPPSVDIAEQYLGVGCVGTNASDDVTFDAFIVPQSMATHSTKSYPTSYSITEGDND